MRPDTKIRQDEATSALRRALQTYPDDARHVAVYVAYRGRDRFKSLRTDLSDTEMPGDPEGISQMIDAVEGHIRSVLDHELDL